MSLYSNLGEYLSDQGYYCFGTDLMGHGKSSLIDGQRYVANPDSPFLLLLSKIFFSGLT